jgi:hypothetical protein
MNGATGIRPNVTRDINRARVREFLVTHPGATRKDVARALRLNAGSVSKHVAALRAEWRPALARAQQQQEDRTS